MPISLCPSYIGTRVGLGIWSYIFILLIQPISGNAQQAQSPNEIWFRSYSVEEGGYPSIFQVHQDDKGYLWLVSTQGIIRYDGYRFKPYTIKSEGGGAVQSKALQLFTDSKDRMWVAFEHVPYVAYSDPETGQFSYLNINTMADSALDAAHVAILGVDQQDRIWLQIKKSIYDIEPIIGTLDTDIDTDSWQLELWINDQGESKFEHRVITRRNPTSGMLTYPFTATSDGTVWIGAEGGVTRIAPDGTLHSYNTGNSGLDNSYMQFIHAFSDHRVWLATQSGIYGWDPETQQIRPLKVPPAMQKATYHALYEDAQGIVWITTETGTWRYDGQQYQPVQDDKLVEELGSPVLLARAEN
jgi:ligand-binding sensor domain-containing protein